MSSQDSNMEYTFDLHISSSDWNAMSSTLVEAESLHVFKVDFAKQKIPVLSNY